MLNNLTSFLSEINQDLIFLLDFLFIVHNFLPQVVLERYEVVRIAYEALVDLSTLARAADWKVLSEVASVCSHLVILMQFLSQRPYPAERHIGLLVQPGCHVFNASDLEQRCFGANQVCDKEVKEQFRLFTPEEKVVKDLYPVIFRERIGEE